VGDGCRPITWTGLSPATRDACSHYLMSPGPYQGYFRNRYLGDLEQSRPVSIRYAVARGAFLGRRARRRSTKVSRTR